MHEERQHTMSSKAKCGAARCNSGAVLHLAFALVLIGMVCLHARAAEPAPGVESAPSHAQHARASSTLDGRVEALSKLLKLDVGQQGELKKLLEGQREQVRKVWDNASMPAAYRIAATQAISDRTADQIRALLNEEQRKKYSPPRLPHETNAGSSPSVEDWMNQTRPKQVRFEPNKEDQNVEIR